MDRLLKLTTVIGNKVQGESGVIPMSRSRWYAGIKSGAFPAPVKIGQASYWRLSEIEALVAKLCGGAA